MSTLRILLADDHDLVRETIASFLRDNGASEVDTVPNLDAALEAVEREGRYDLVLLDYNMPGMNGLEGLARMVEMMRDRPVAILTGETARSTAEAAVRAGARGFVPKTLTPRSLLSATRFMLAGETYVPFEMLQVDKEPDAGFLTRRESEVLKGLCAGKSNKEIAIDHDLQEVTVKLHVKTLSRKLGARNRTHAAMIARDRGLV